MNVFTRKVVSSHPILIKKDPKNKMEFTGKIIAVLPAKGGVSSRSGNEWKAQEYVIEDSMTSQFPRRMCFEVFGADRISQFNIQMGEQLTVSFDIDANQWQDRWFNRIRAWKVERVAQGAPAPQPAAPAPAATGAPVPPPAQPTPAFIAGDANDDLPF